MPFQIVGVAQDGVKKQTRLLAPSAAVLAIKWTEAGLKDVKIIDNGGRSYDLQSFRVRVSENGGLFTPF